MRGPIIKEHLTNATVAGGGSKEYYVKHDGRIMRVFVKGTVDAARASGAVTVTLWRTLAMESLLLHGQQTRLVTVITWFILQTALLALLLLGRLAVVF